MLIKKTVVATALLSIFLATPTLAKKNVNTKPYPFGNPVVTNMFTADAAPKVMPDGRVWMVTSVDDPTKPFYNNMHSLHAFSTADMKHWVDHGRVLDLADMPEPDEQDWAIWAPDVVYRNGTYYIYYPMRNLLDKTKGREGGIDRYTAIAESSRMDQKFTITNPRIKNSQGALDPSVFIDDDGVAYLYWNGPKMAVLDETLREFEGEPFQLDIGAKNFMEAAWMHKRRGKYYFNYHTHYEKPIDPNLPDDPERMKSNLDFSYGDSPTGPLVYGGTLNEELGASMKEGPRMPGKEYVPWRLTQSNHGGIVEYHGKEYLFYHNSALSSWRQDEFNDMGTWTQRSVCIDEIHYNDKGQPLPVQQTLSSVASVQNHQPFKVRIGNADFPASSVVSFKNVDLGTGYYYLGANVLDVNVDGKLEVRLDSPEGTLVGSITLTEARLTGRDGLIETFLREANGTHDVYFVHRKGTKTGTLRLRNIRFFAGSSMNQ